MLRHKIHFDGFDAVDRSVEKRLVLPKFKKPVQVGYARGADMTTLVDVVKKNTQVVLAAAVGAGKSTKVPLELSRAMGCLVIHTIPFSIAARALADYLGKLDDGGRVCYVDDLECDLPQQGVMITTNGYIHARLARDGLAGVKDAVLFLDEVHESDAATAVLREVAPALAMFKCVIRASATQDPGQAIKPRLPGSVNLVKFPRVEPRTWSAGDRGKPWSAAMIEGNVAIVVERVELRDKLRREYTDHGFDVRILLASTDYEYYKETIRRLKDPNSGIVVVLCDYAYRSSLSIPGLTSIIETGEVAVSQVQDGHPVVRYRDAYDFEVQQFLGRAGRFDTDRVTLWQSNQTPPSVMCDLECLEGDAANLLYRLLGFRPPLDLADFDYYNGLVPIDIAAAMVSDHPLTLCPVESRVAWINGHLPLMEEKKRAAYEYSLSRQKTATRMDDRRRRYASCHTVADVDARPPSPPPPVPAAYAVTQFDVDELDPFFVSRTRSPSVSTVVTVETNSVKDTISMLQEDLAFAKPKRIAQRVLDERAARAALEAAEDKPPPVPEKQGVSVLQPVVVYPERKSSVASLVAPVAQATTVATTQSSVERLTPMAHMGNLRGVLSEVVAAPKMRTVPEEMYGSYIYYSGMDMAPDISNYFWRGLESVLQLAMREDARVIASGLPKVDRLYAMRKLVDEYNNCTAVAMGIQRLFMEVSKRPPVEWRDLLDHTEFMNVVDWISGEATAAQARVRVCNSAMALFADRSLESIPSAVELEQSVMVEMMDRFDAAAVKKDPDKAGQYVEMLNRRNIRIAPRR